MKPPHSRRHQRVLALIAEGELRVAEAARLLGVHRATLSRRRHAAGINPRAARRAYVERQFAQAVAIGREIAASGKPVREALDEAMERRG